MSLSCIQTSYWILVTKQAEEVLMEGEDATVATEDSPRMHVDEQVWPSVYLTDVNKL